jgi:hypothetical protein
MTPSQIDQARTLLYDRNAVAHQLRQLAASEGATVKGADFEWQATDEDIAAVKGVVSARLEARKSEIEAALGRLGVTDLDEAAVVRS